MKRSIFVWLFVFTLFALVLVAAQLGTKEVAAGLGSGVSTNLSITINAGYNLVVDSNALTPATFAPEAATISAQVCNVSGGTLNNVYAYIGDFNGSPATSTYGIYPVRTTTDPGFNTLHPDLYNAAVSNGRVDSYQFTHIGGRTGLKDARRYIGSLAVGQCSTQYWHFSYPYTDPGAAVPVWGRTNDPTDDLFLDFDVWATEETGDFVDATWRMTHRNEISAMANKIQPNPNGIWFNTNKDVVGPGDTITSNGVLYELGNIRQGFDNDGDFKPDYNAWLQPIGNASYDPSCFRLIKTTGLITVSRSSGQSDLVIPFDDQLYFTDLPPDNTGVLGLVKYTFLALDGPCVTGLTPYQEVASGFDNEKFNADFGAGLPPLGTFEPEVLIQKGSAPNMVALGSSITYQVPFQNVGTFDAGLTLATSDVYLPVMISDTIPADTTYLAGTAKLVGDTYTGGATIRYSTDNGNTWATTEPVPASLVTTIQWWLNEPLPAGTTSTGNYAEFQVQVTALPATGFVDNCATVGYGESPPFGEACTSTGVYDPANPNSIGDFVWEDINSDGIQDAGEPGLDNITVWLYWDKNGNGELDDGENLLATQVTSGGGNYDFTNLPNGDYIVKVDLTDPDIPTGYGITTSKQFAVSVSGGQDYNDADFGFTPTLGLTKTLISSDPAYEGQEVVYTIDLANNLPGNGTGKPAACTYTIWATAAIPDNSDTPPGGTSANARWVNPNNALNAPDGSMATTNLSDTSDLLGLSGFNLASQGGTITSVAFIGYLEEVVNLKATDTFNVRVYYGDAQIGTDYSYGGGTYFTGGAGTAYLVQEDITGLRAWTWADFQSNTTETQVEGSKGSGGGASGDIGLDAFGYVITTDQECGGDVDDTIATLPLTDTFNADLLTFVAAVPSESGTATSASPYANTGVITWDDLGPLFPGATKTITVTFLAKEPPGNISTPLPNNAYVTGAKYPSGLPANDASDTATTTLVPTGSIGDTVWNDNGAGGGIASNGAQEGAEPGIPGATIYLCTATPCTQAGAVQTTTTDSNGNYLFEGLLDGNYYVAVDTTTLPGGGSGLVNTFDDDGNTDSESGQVTICQNACPGGVTDYLGADFGYTIPTIIRGTVWHDRNKDGASTPDPGEEGFAGVTVCIQGTANCTTTDQNGMFELIVPTGGTYVVVVSSSTGDMSTSTWTPSFDTDGTGTTDIVSVTVSTGDIGYADYSYYNQTVLIGDTVYKDWNGNGMQDAGEEGIPNVDVSLYLDANNDGVADSATPLATAVTDANGIYNFSVADGYTYLVKVDSKDIPALWVQTEDPDGTPDHQAKLIVVSGNAVSSIGGSPCTNCDLDIDFGYQPLGYGSIGDFVWRDDDGDSIQDPGEIGLGGVSVRLYEDTDGNGTIDVNDALISTTLTLGDGSYLFSNLPAGNYLVDVDSSISVGGITYVVTTDDPHVVALASGEKYLDADFGYTVGGVIGDFIWQDNDGDGIQDIDEPGIDGVTVQLCLATDPACASPLQTAITVSGLYTFTGVPAGEYIVVVSNVPAGFSQTSDPDDTGYCGDGNDPVGCDLQTQFKLYAGQVDRTRDFGFKPPNIIGDFVWFDTNANGVQEAGEIGIGDVTVTLTPPAGVDLGNGPGVSVANTTDTDGYYSYGNLPDGTYTIAATTPAGMVITYDQDNGIVVPDGSVSFTVTGGVISACGTTTCTVFDFGYRLNGAFSISGTVFFDSGNDGGAYDGGVADSPFEGITVYLFDSTNKRIGATKTGPNGGYLFGGLPAGDYTVSIAPSPNLDHLGMTSSYSELPGVCTVCQTYTDPKVTVVADVTGVDFGYFGPTYDFGDLPDSYSTKLGVNGARHIVNGLFLGNAPDTEPDGKASVDATGDTDEGVALSPGFIWKPGNVVELQVIISGPGTLAGWFDWNNDGDFADANEFVDFGAVTAATTTLQINIPVGAVVGTSSSTSLAARFRLFDSANLPGGSLDLADYRGIATGGEVEDYLWKFGSIGDFVWDDLNGNGVQDGGEPGISGVVVELYTGTGVLVTSTTTDGAGNYIFTGVISGSYYVKFGSPAGYIFTNPDQVGDTVDSDADRTTGETIVFSLLPGGVDTTWDAGLTVPATLGDFVWEDLNGNGIQDAGEPGLSGVVVELFTGTGASAGTISTDANGIYTFTNVIPGDYYVVFTAPAGYNFTLANQGADDTIDSDANASGQTATTTLTQGETDLTWDAGLYQPATIGDQVWDDLNANGIQDAGEPGLSGVAVELFTSSGVSAGTTTTDASGNYAFTGVAPGDYYLVFTAPAGYTFTPANQGANDAVDSDANASGQTATTTLISGETDLTWDAGLYQPAQIGDLVWEDMNANGIQDAGEPGLSGVTVELFTSTGTSGGTTTTDAIGNYTFTGIVPGDYYLVFTAPAGYTFTSANQGADDTIDSDANASGQTVTTTLISGEIDLTWDAGLYQLATIGDRVWEDLNANGIQDAGELGLNGVTVELFTSGGVSMGTTTTDATGNYAFAGLVPGDYYLVFTAPGGYAFTPANQGADDTIDSDANGSGQTATTSLSSGETDLTWDAGLYQPATIGDRVWDDLNANGIQDAGEPGLSGVTVELFTSAGTSVGTTTTDASGNYAFTGLVPGDYYIVFTAPGGYVFTPADQGANDAVDSDANASGQTTTTTLISGETDLTWDAGLYQPATIGDRVWEDLNINGFQNAGEPGLSGITVELFTGAGVPAGTTTTNATGNYAFSGLTPGDYYLVFTAPGGYVFTPANQGADDAVDSDANASGQTTTTTLISGETDLTWDAGLYQPAAIGDRVWEDLNANGIQDAGEPGLSGATVELFTSTGTLVGTTTTDASGNYAFTGLTTGDYYLVFTAPGGYVFTPANQGADDTVDSDANASGQTAITTLPSGGTDLTWDAGLYQLATIGDRVWDDLNANGIQDGGEAGLSGATVELFTSTGTSVGTTTTDASGNYAFIGIVPGDYYLVFTAPAGYTFTSANQGADDTVDSDANASGQTATTTLTSGETDLTWDAGLYQLSGIGDRVWEDLNVNGIQDAGEPGLSGVTVELFTSTGTSVGTTTTDASGNYAFSGLMSGDYYLVFTVPGGYVFTPADQGADDAVDSDANASGQTATTTLALGETDLTWDAGMYQPPAIGDRVWEDLNANGIQDPGEPGLSGITVELFTSAGVPVGTTTTDASGNYAFTRLTTGDYYLVFTPPAGYVFSAADQGADDAVDSDANASGQTATTNLSSGETDLTWDAGLYQLATIGDRAWNDLNTNGLQDAGEPGLSGVTVELFTSTGVSVGTTTTDASGNYAFTGIVPGDYYLGFTAPGGYNFTLANQGGDDTVDSDVNASGQTAITTLTSGETDLSWDAGLQLVAFPSVSIDKILVSSSPVYLTDLVTYTLRIENTGPTILTVIPLEDIYDTAYLTFASAVPAPDTVDPAFTSTSGRLFWNDITTVLGDFAPGRVVDITVVMTATGITPPGVLANNRAVVDNVVDQNGNAPPGGGVIDQVGVVIIPNISLSKVLDTQGTIRVGDEITFTIRITNEGKTDIVVLPLQDIYDAAYLDYVRASIPPDNAVPGTIDWFDLTTSQGDLLPGASIDVQVVFLATAEVTNTTNVAIVTNALDSKGNVMGVSDDAGITVISPTAVELMYFKVSNRNSTQVTLEWETAAEIDNFGFYLYRSETNDFSTAVRVGFVPSALPGGNGYGAHYVFVDQVSSQVRYWYWLEDIDTSGLRNAHSRFEAQANAFGLIFLPLLGGGR